MAISTSTAQSQLNPPGERIRPLGLTLLFGVLYFIQGLCEPTDGLLAQPVNSLLKSWWQDAGRITAFTALFWLPWAIKPVYGLVSDFLPIAGLHRKSYLVLTSLLSAGAFGLLWQSDLDASHSTMVLALLMAATVGIAFTDVVVDALMVTKGQPHGLTGRFQATQWGMLYAGSILAGWGGGYLAHHALQKTGFAICAVLSLGTLAVTLVFVREPRTAGGGSTFGATLSLLRRASASRLVIVVGAFLFLWNFNPFSTTALYLHVTRELKLSEPFYGHMLAMNAVGGMVGSLTYALYCRRVPMRALIHISIVLGVVSSLAYWALEGHISGQIIATVAGFATATATVIQLDLAAQVCPPQVAGTLFALLLGLSNLGTALAMRLGGHWYENWSRAWSDPLLAFNALVAIRALFTAGCWLLVPLMNLRPAEADTQS